MIRVIRKHYWCCNGAMTMANANPQDKVEETPNVIQIDNVN